MLVSNNLERDSRVRKEATSLALAGARVTVVGVGDEVPVDIDESSPYELLLSRPCINGKPLNSKWGKESVFYPIRVAVNKTINESRPRLYKQRELESGYPYYIARQDMIETALSRRYDFIHAHDLDTLYAGHEIAKRSKAGLVYDSHELFLSLHSLEEHDREMLAQIEERIFPHIKSLVTVSDEIGERLINKYERFDLVPVVLYNGSIDIVERVQPTGNVPKILFQGVFASDRNLVELVEAMDLLRGKATLTLQGWGGEFHEIEEAIRRLDLGCTVHMVNPVPPGRIIEAASNYDIGIINSIAADENFLVTLPNKLFDYMCAGLAVASTNFPSISKIVHKEQCGVLYEQKGAMHTGKILLNLVSDISGINEMKAASLAAAPKYSWEAQEKKLIHMYLKLSNSRQSRSEH